MRPSPPTSPNDLAEVARLMRKLHALGKQRGLTHDDLTHGANVGFHVESLADLTPKQFKEYIQRLSNSSIRSEPGSATPVHTGVQRHTVRPRGKIRPEGVVWLPSRKQRTYIADLLRQLFGGHPDPLSAAVSYTRAKIGADLPADFCGTAAPGCGLTDADAIAAAIQTGKAGGTLINCLIGELKKRGLWGRPSPTRTRHVEA